MFFEKFREATARLPDGLIRPAPPASPAALKDAEARLGAALPTEYASFLRSFDGVDLFHEAIVVAGVGDAAPCALMELNEDRARGELVFAETIAGDRFALDVFEDDGEEVAPAVVLKQTERALKIDPGSAGAQHERGLALRSLGRTALALEAFAAATALDTDDPWPWFDLGRTALAEGRDFPRAREA